MVLFSGRTSYPEFKNKELLTQWSLADNIIVHLSELENHNQWMATKETEMEPLKYRLENLLYNNEEEYESDRAYYNLLIDQYNTKVTRAKEISESIDILINKYDGLQYE